MQEERFSNKLRAVTQPTPMKIVAIYAAVTVAWIMFADGLFAPQDAVPDGSIQSLGWAYVAGTAVLLYWLTHRLAYAYQNVQGALHATDANLEAVVNTAVDSIITIDEKGVILTANPATERMFGYRLDEMIGRNVKMLMPPSYRSRHDGYIANYLHSGDPKIIGIGREVTGQRRDGSVFPAELAVSEVRIGDRRFFTGILRDISERKAGEEKLRLERDFNSAVVEAAGALVVVMDREGRIARFNRICERLTGRSFENVDGRPVWEVLSTFEAAPSFRAAIEEVVTGGALVRHEGICPARDGTLRTMAWCSSPLPDPSGRVGHVIATGLDITERRTMERSLVQAQKMEAVGHLTGGVAHDFNNLLTVIIGNLEILEAELKEIERPSRPKLGNQERGGQERGRRSKPKAECRPPKDTPFELLQSAQQAAHMGANLTDRLLAFARRHALHPQTIDLNTLVLDTTELLQRTLGESIRIGTALNNGLWPARTDPNQVQNCLLNLAINARDAMPHGGTLTIETGNVVLDEHYARAETDLKPGQYVMLAVTDTGTGIPPELLNRVFEPFFTTKEHGHGTGMGLSMVYGFAKQSEGHVKIYSEPGHGTTVKLYLPRATGAEAAGAGLSPSGMTNAPESMPSDLPGGSETILVVEDDPHVLKLVARHLNDLGYTVLTGSSGVDGLSHIASGEHIDLLFTDLVMPGGLSGTDLAEEARKLQPGLKVLFTSGYAEAAVVNSGMLSADMHLLRKPHTKRELACKVRAVLNAEPEVVA